MRAAGQQLFGAADGSAGLTYNSAVYPSSQAQYGAPGRPPVGGHMVGPPQSVPRTDPTETGAGPGPMKQNAKAAMFAGQQQQQQRSAPYPNPHRYMQSRRPQFINAQTPAEV